MSTSVAKLLTGHPTDLPEPGRGQTASRFDQLWEIAATAPSAARLLEAHHDARSILREAGQCPYPSSTFGVWAAGGPDPATLGEDGRLTGTKHWCSGATLVTHALVTARHRGSNALVLVTLDAPGVTLEAPNWVSPALADVDTRSVRFDLAVQPDEIVGVDDWYLERAGFWSGAVGVAACWAGCADGIVRRLADRWPTDPHAAAHLGAIDSGLWTMRAAIRAAAEEIDDAARRGGEAGTARQRRALRVRHLVDQTVGDITTRLARAVGPGPLAHVPGLHEAIIATDLYRRQCHAERDLEVLGRLHGA